MSLRHGFTAEANRLAVQPQADPAVSVVGPGDGETIVLATTRMRVLEDGSHTGHHLAIAESVLAPRTQGPPQHRHAQHDEGFYVLSGTVRFTVGAEDYSRPVQSTVTAPLSPAVVADARGTRTAPPPRPRPAVPRRPDAASNLRNNARQRIPSPLPTTKRRGQPNVLQPVTRPER
ncbi:cupin domain-containing protein [Streptomyces sp. NPDC006668]|uniref:cupin domain-containing protein n=1 Tax=Streptomyces sp. NPDC006668 TaxID=3156903 RepID=UPI0033F1484F